MFPYVSAACTACTDRQVVGYEAQPPLSKTLHRSQKVSRAALSFLRWRDSQCICLEWRVCCMRHKNQSTHEFLFMRFSVWSATFTCLFLVLLRPPPHTHTGLYFWKKSPVASLSHPSPWACLKGPMPAHQDAWAYPQLEELEDSKVSDCKGRDERGDGRFVYGLPYTEQAPEVLKERGTCKLSSSSYIVKIFKKKYHLVPTEENSIVKWHQSV